MYHPHFTISNKILKNIGLIEACREVITNAPLVPAWEKKFQEEAIVRQVHHGTHLEGNPLNISEAARVVAGQEIIGRARDIQEVINYRNVIRFIEKFQKTEDRRQKTVNGRQKTEKENTGLLSSEPRPPSSVFRSLNIDEKLIKKLHKLTTEKILTPEKSGKFRQKQVVIRNSQTGEVTFRPPPAVEVPYLLEDFLSWLDSPAVEIHPVLKSGIAQYEMVRIHPFLDGNGRVARALATLILYKEGYDIRRFFSLEEYYDKEAEGYYKALQSVSQKEVRSEEKGVEVSQEMRDEKLEKKKGPYPTSNLQTHLQTQHLTSCDLTPWLEYFSEGLAIELTRIKEKIQKISVDMHLKERLGGQQIFLSERQIKIVEHLQSVGHLQNQMFPQLFPMISEDTILRELKDLVKKRIIVKKGKTKGARYVLRQ